MRKPTWKQDTPKEQAVALIAAARGWLSNLEDGTNDPVDVAKAVNCVLDDLLALTRNNMQQAWSPND